MTRSLVELPVELLTTVARNLSKRSLRQLCLVGNHVLLAIAQPLLWREITYHVKLDGTRPKRLSLLTTNQRIAGSVVSAKITFSGPYDYNRPITRLLEKSLKSLTSLNCASLHFSEASSVDIDKDSPSLLEVVLKSLVCLKSVCIKGYLVNEERIVLPIKLPWLKNIAVGHCSPIVAQTWTLVEKLEALELAGRPEEQYYLGSGQERDHRYTGNSLGTDYLLNKGLLHSGYFDHTRRLHVTSVVDFGGSRKAADHIIEFFTLCPNSLKALEELILDLPFTVSEYEFMLGCVAVPHLKRLMIRIEQQYELWREIDSALSRTRWTELTSLEELWLPRCGVQDETLTPMSCLKSLKYLYFYDNDEDTGDFHQDEEMDDNSIELVTSMGTVLPRLKGVSWTDHFKIYRDQGGTIETVIRQEYEQPKWLMFSPMTK